MRTVVIRLSGKDFSTAIVRIRHWLEKHRCEPSAYRYDQDEHTVVVSVNFAVDAQAKAFAKRFNGEIGDQRTTPVGSASAITPLRDLQYPPRRSGGTAKMVSGNRPGPASEQSGNV